MKTSGDREIARDPVIGKADELFTAETQRRTEEPINREAMSGWLGETPNPCHPERAQLELCETSAIRRSPVLPASGNTASGSSTHAPKPLLRRFQDALHILRAVFCEIFDESAYHRFLQRTQASQSAESYRAFLRERESAIARKPRCC